MSHAHLSAARFVEFWATTVNVLVTDLVSWFSAVVNLTDLPIAKCIPGNTITNQLWLSLLFHNCSGLAWHLRLHLHLHLLWWHLSRHWFAHHNLLIGIISLHHRLRLLLVLHLHSRWLLLHHTWLLLLHLWLHLHTWLLHAWLLLHGSRESWIVWIVAVLDHLSFKFLLLRQVWVVHIY